MNFFIQPDGLDLYEARKSHHLTWLQERTIDALLQQVDDEDDASHEPSLEALDKVTPLSNSPMGTTESTSDPVFEEPAYDSDPEGFSPGSIRILAPSLTDPGALRPIYVLVLGEWELGWTWIAPFSLYSAPATELEVLTNQDPEPLQVLQVWNARTCQDELLQKSWFVTHLDSSLVEDAKMLYRSMISGEPVTDVSLLRRLGTKITQENDPRLSYLQEEMQRLDTLSDHALIMSESETSAERSASSTSQSAASNIITFPLPRVEERLAAAGGESERELVFFTLGVKGQSILITLAETEAHPNHFVLFVSGDEEGYLEGAQVKGGDGNLLGTIHHHQAGSGEQALPLASEGMVRFSLLRSDGSEVDVFIQNDSDE